MSKHQEENEEVIVDVQEVYSKTETYIEENKSTLSIIATAIVVVIGSYFAYTSFYLAPLQEEAQSEMFMAEKYFGLDSFNLAINGNAQFAGFAEIADNYGSTKAGNLAHYYLGISFLRTGQFEAAISELESFSSDDMVLGTVALGAIGDAYSELGDLNKAASFYDKAASREENDFTTPYYLMKSGNTYELIGDYNAAIKCYKAIKGNYKVSQEFSQIEKYIARAESFIK